MAILSYFNTRKIILQCIWTRLGWVSEAAVVLRLLHDNQYDWQCYNQVRASWWLKWFSSVVKKYEAVLSWWPEHSLFTWQESGSGGWVIYFIIALISFNKSAIQLIISLTKLFGARLNIQSFCLSVVIVLTMNCCECFCVDLCETSLVLHTRVECSDIVSCCLSLIMQWGREDAPECWWGGGWELIISNWPGWGERGSSHRQGNQVTTNNRRVFSELDIFLIPCLSYKFESSLSFLHGLPFSRYSSKFLKCTQLTGSCTVYSVQFFISFSRDLTLVVTTWSPTIYKR